MAVFDAQKISVDEWMSFKPEFHQQQQQNLYLK
jgi:hypothetical protein